MDKATHTPGRWAHGHLDQTSVSIWSRLDGAEHNPIFIAEAEQTDGVSFEEFKANVRLLTAAPALLAELIDVAASLELHAELLDRWACESVSGGWSTRQVDDQRRKADTFRRQAVQVRRTIARATEQRP